VPEGLPHPSVLERHAAQGSLHRLVAAWGGRGSDSPRAGALALVARALRVDLALLRARPGLLFPCLWNRLWWADSPEAAPFYGVAPPPGGASGPVRAWLEAWRAARPAFATWLRSLRPPEHELNGALLEEWRGAFFLGRGPFVLDEGARYVTVEGRLPGDKGERGLLRWDRHTGEVDAGGAAPLERPAEPDDAWRAVGGERAAAGGVVLERRGERVGPFALEPGDRVLGARTAPGGGAIVLWGCQGDRPFVASFDLRARGFAGRWRAPRRAWRRRLDGPGRLNGLRLSPDGAAIVVHDSHGAVALLDAHAGETRCVLRESSTVDVRFGDGGALLLTLAVGVVRTWAVDRLPGHRCLTGHRGHLVYGEFSPAGARAVTGALLCDGRTGALVARLDAASADEYSGDERPPPGGQALLDEWFLEVCPRRGLRAWRASTGEFAFARPDLRLERHNVMAYSPDGRFYAYRRSEWPPGRPDVVRVGRLDAPARPDAAGERAAGAAAGGALDERDVTVAGEGVRSLAFAPDASALAVGDDDGTVRLFDVPSLAPRWATRAHAGPVDSITFDLTGERFVTASPDGTLRVGRVDDGATVAARPVADDEAERLIDTPGGRYVGLWRPVLGAFAALDGWAGLRARPATAAPLLRGRRTHDGLFELVDAAGRAVAVYPWPHPLTPSPDGRHWVGAAVHLVLEEGRPRGDR
jgi:hypothetical protein